MWLALAVLVILVLAALVEDLWGLLRDLLVAVDCLDQFRYLVNCEVLPTLQDALRVLDHQLPLVEERVYLLGVGLELLEVTGDGCLDEVGLLVD